MSRPDPERTQALLETRVDLAEGLAIFRLALERDFPFKAGQYATLWLTHAGTTIPRPYSIASSPSETRSLEFYINLVEHGRLTPSLWDPEVLHGLETRAPGTELAITGPNGRFILQADDPRDLVFIASGTGLAPFVSMIRKLNDDYLSAPDRFRRKRAFVIHGVSYSRNLGYRGLLEGLAHETSANPERGFGVIYLPTISRPWLDPEWQGLQGRAETLLENSPASALSPARLPANIRTMLRVMLDPARQAVYICGHPGTIDNAVAYLTARGFEPERDLKTEKYYPETDSGITTATSIT